MSMLPMPVLADLEAEIERRGLKVDYTHALTDIIDGSLVILDEFIELDDAEKCHSSHDFIIALTRLTETQKVQAALKVLNAPDSEWQRIISGELKLDGVGVALSGARQFSKGIKNVT